MIHQTAAHGFVHGDVYERGRAGYPEAIVDAIGIDQSTRVVDLGCGTGKLTRMLAFSRVVGVEPLPPMLATFREQLPDVPVIVAIAEAIPLRDSSSDVVTCASAFHWFDHARALPELHRVLRPGGRLAIIWNRRDELTGWPEEFWKITERYRGDTPGYRSGAWRTALEGSPFFGPIEEHSFHHSQLLDIDGAVARVASISFIDTHPKRDEILSEARLFLENLGVEEIELPYRTRVYVCENLGHA